MEIRDNSKHYTLDPLADGVYAAIASYGGSAICNAGLIDLGDSTLIIDTFLTPLAAEHLRADALRLTGRVPRWVVNTHYHNDHIWGNQVFLPDADLISTVETQGLIRTAGKLEYDGNRANASDQLKSLLAQEAAAETAAQRADIQAGIGYFGGLVHDFPRLRVTLPNLVFENHMALYGSQRRVELIAFSGGHTGSDTVVFLPDDGIVFMSDLLFVDFHPYLGDGDPQRWLEVLRSILDGSAGIHGVNRFVPGHGPTGTSADVQQIIDYIQDCQKIAQMLIQENKTGEADVAAVPVPEAYTGWTMPRFFHANIQFLIGKYQKTTSSI